ncbi:MAG TPA: TAXI family TRAP transporter solute-binding subunit [Burkholderiales bacterium]|nr:TAXI family TRAP transporter solute-binding subunit [Burkholderiales bacterium]
MRARLAVLIVLSLSLYVVGCSIGPDDGVLQKDVSGWLAQAVPENTITVQNFTRRGSQSDTKAPAGETRRIVYFDIELKLQRDYDFGAWDSPGVAGIVSALGVANKGLVGINAGGNKAGDIVRAHGTALYKREGKEWLPVVSGGFTPSAAPAYATSAPGGGTAEFLKSIRKIAESIPGNIPTSTRHAIERELDYAQASIQSALARAEAGYSIAAGPEHGQYLRFARALPDDEAAKMVPLVTRGGEENLRMLRDGTAQLAISQADAAMDAFQGQGNFAKSGAYPTLRAVGSLYPEAVHIIVRGDSKLASAADLAGRRVVVGPEGSASRTTALRVLDAHNLGPNNVELVDLSLGDALVELRNKKVDAVIQIIGVPADHVRDALADIPLRLMPLSPGAIAKLTTSRVNKGYFAFTIPRGAYAVQTQDVPTIATAALLLASPNLSETEVSALTRYVYGGKRDFAARGSAQGTQVSAANAWLGLSIPQHVAAAKTLEELAKLRR